MKNLKNKKKRGISRLFIDFFRLTPFHPQWLIYRDTSRCLTETSKYAHGLVIDIGCGSKDIKKFLPEESNYIGLDYYYTSIEWYKSDPDVYGDAHALPFKTGSVNTVILLDVLEHLHGTDECISEIRRVLDQNGTLILQVPFVYPVHDAPLDFYRWTLFGIKELISKHGFKLVNESYKGDPFETSFLLLNIALSKTFINWIRKRNPACIFLVLLPPFILLNNIIAWVFSLVSPPDPIMPFGYRVILEKS